MITFQEEGLLRLIKEIGFGELKVSITDGKPHTVRQLVKTIRLDKRDISKNDKPLKEEK